MDRLTTKATPEGTLSYTYDAAGNLASMTSRTRNGVSVSYSYDGLNRLSTVVDAESGWHRTPPSYSYDTASNVATRHLSQRCRNAVHVRSLNRVTSACLAGSGYHYQRGADGQSERAATESTAEP